MAFGKLQIFPALSDQELALDKVKHLGKKKVHDLENRLESKQIL
jgi:hypothetical protein